MKKEQVKRPQWGRTIRISSELYQRLDAQRKTERGKVRFDELLRFILSEYERLKKKETTSQPR